MFNKLISPILLSLIAVNAYAEVNSSGLLVGSESPVTVSSTKDGKCYIYPMTTIITKSFSNTVGEQILVKPGVDKKCKWEDKTGNWLLSNDANYFIGKWRNLLFVDNGTGPDMRQILVFDLNNHRQQFGDTYFEPLQIAGNNLQYWKATLKIATKDNCDKFAEAAKTGLTPQIQQLNIVNLNNSSLVGLPQKNKLHCALTQ